MLDRSEGEALRQQLDDLQIQQAFQEDTLNTLNKELSRQQAEISRLTRLCEQLDEQLRTASAAVSEGEVHERPPHY